LADEHGGLHGGQESTILALNTTLYHWGMVIVPLGYTVREVFAAGGNPYGTSYTSGHRVTGPDASALAVARHDMRSPEGASFPAGPLHPAAANPCRGGHERGG
jgi:multimeric flavodoxin WrbA